MEEAPRRSDHPGRVHRSRLPLAPGLTGNGKDDFYGQTGLTKWTADRFWKEEGGFYTTPRPRPTRRPSRPSTPWAPLFTGRTRTRSSQDERNRALAERDAFQHLRTGPWENAGADDARIFLASGGFPRTAPQPDTAEYRIAVEDLKTRFAVVRVA